MVAQRGPLRVASQTTRRFASCRGQMPGVAIIYRTGSFAVFNIEYSNDIALGRCESHDVYARQVEVECQCAFVRVIALLQ